MDRLEKLNAAKQVFVAIATQYGPPVGINNGAQWVTQYLQHIVDDLHQLDGVDNMFFAMEAKNTNNRTEQVLQNLEEILGHYAGPNTQLKQHVKATVDDLGTYINDLKGHRPINVMPAANRDAAIEKFITGIKVLKTALDAVAKDCDAWLVKTKSMVAGYRGILTGAQQIQRNFGTNLKACVARALAAAQKMKANPNQATYDHEMDHGARDLHAALVPARNTWQAWNIPNPAPHLQALMPYASGGGRRTIPNNTPPATIVLWISGFNQAAKAIKQTYGA
jgi:hypothetical protein